MKYLVALIGFVIVGSLAVDAEAQLLRRNRCSSGNCGTSWGNSISCSSGPTVVLASTDKILGTETNTVATSYQVQQSAAQKPLQKPTQTAAQKSFASEKPRRLFRRRARSRTFAIERTRSFSRG